MEDSTSFAPTYVPTAEELEQAFSALGDSVWVIDSLVESPRENQTAEEAAEEIERNVAHLKLMIEKDYIKSAGRS